MKMNTEQLNNRLRGAGILALTLLSVLFAVKIITEIKGLPEVGDTPTDMSRVISVTGHSDIQAVPDTATFSWTVSENGKTVEEAQNNAATKSNAAIDYLKKNGVDAADISNDSYNTSEMYDYNAPCTVTNTVSPAVAPASDVSGPMIPVPPPTNQCPKIIGYTTNQTVTVKIHNVKQGDNTVGTLIAGVGQFGVKPSDANFTFDDSDGVKQQARIAAIQKARSQAEEIASALGVQLKGVVSFNESYGGFPVAYANDATVMSAKAMSAPVSPEIPNGNQTVSADVTVTYSIR